MKKLIRFLLLTIVTAGVCSYAEAQRGDRGGAGNRERGSNVSRNERGNYADRTYRSTNIQSRNIRENNSNNYSGIINRNQQGNDIALLDRSRYNNYSITQQRTYRENTNIGRVRYPSQNIGQRNALQRNYNYNTYNNYNRSYNRGGYYPRYFFMSGPRYTVLPRNSVSIYFGGYPYYYNDGFFYGHFGGYYEPLFPPLGIHIGVLPFGYSRVFVGLNLFYYYNGIYYRHHPNREDYEVVDAPMGATVSSLPKGAKSVVLNGEKLYELNGTYYKEDRNYKGETVYTVVGKNGEVNNSDNADENVTTPPASLNPGEIINQLPDGSKVVTINGEKLFVTPDDTYLKEESDGSYKVVGK